MTSCSVIMVTYHTGPILFASINSALKQKQLAELIVVDNGNPPDVIARLQQMALTDIRLRVLTGHGNIGFSKGSNLGAKKATGYFVTLLNPDCLLPPDALKDVMLAFENNQEAVVVGCELLNADGSVQRGNVRSLLTPGSAVKEFFHLRKRTIDYPKDVPSYVPAISGAFMCLRRKDFERLNGLDEAYVVRGAGMDLCMRVRKFGGRMMVVPTVKVTRLHTNEESSKRVIEWYRARGLMHYFKRHFSKHYPLGFDWLVKLLVMKRFLLQVLREWFGRKMRPSYVLNHSIAAKRLMVLASGLADLPEGKELYGKTVLVTGATSQVGLCVLRRLLASGAAVLAISRGDAIPFAHERLRWIKGDLTDANLHLDGYLLDIMVHCAPLWHLPPTLELLAEAEVKRIIAIGSTSVFGNVLSKNARERDLVEKWMRSEVAIAEQCKSLGIDWTVLRPTTTYGVGLDVNVTSLTKLINFLGFFPVYPPAFGRRQPVHADDLAIAVLQVISHPATFGKSYNISGGEVVTYREMLERLFTICGKKTRIVENTVLPFLLDVAGRLTGKDHINGEIARRMNDDLVFFHDDAKRDFGFAPRPFLSGGMKDIEGY